jgi:hypothetical protein
MSNTSRRRATASRRRVAVAAGALLAGAAIPIAAAGTAWADETSDTSGNTGPAIPIAASAAADAASPDATVPEAAPTKMQSVAELVKEGLTTPQATAVFNAEQPGGTAVEVSFKGKIVVEANQGGTAGTDAIAKAAATATAAAIGGGSTSDASGKTAVAFIDGATPRDNSDHATARGTHAQAFVDDATDSKATTSNGGVAVVLNNGGGGTLSKDTATATGAGSFASVNGLGGANVTDDTADASKGGQAKVQNFGADSGTISNDEAKADGAKSTAAVTDNLGSQDVQRDKVTATGGGSASITNTNAVGGTVSDDTATAAKGEASVTNAGDSRASATGASSQATVGPQPAPGSFITGSSAEDNNGTTTNVTTSDTHMVNGVVVPRVEMIPLIDVHEMHMMPPMPMP